MSNVPTNLIPTRVTQLPEYTGSSTAGYLPYVLNGTTYKVQFSNIAAVGAVPASRSITAGTGLTGGGDLSADRVIAIANGGVGYDELALSGVTSGTYGSGVSIPVLTVDDKGRVTAATTASVSISGYVPDTRTITAGSGLLGGGSLAANRTFSVDFYSSTPQALGAASAGVSTAAARGDHVHPAVDLADTSQTQGALPLGRGGTGDALSPVAGAVVYSTGTKFALTNPGIAGQVLVSNGTDEPQWMTLPGLGTVTSVNASGGTTGLTFTGGPITEAGVLTLGGTLAVASGGTGATTAANARTNLGAAASGANADITSMTGVTGGIATPDFIDFDLTAAPAISTGRLAWNPDDGTLDIGLTGGSVLQTGQETMYYAKNTAGVSIPNGTPVMFTGSVGASGKITFGPAVADGTVPADYMMGVTTQTVANNGFGYVTAFGLVRGFDTSGTPYGETWVDGDLLYFSPTTPGAWTKVKPAAPALHIPVAVVVNAATGGSGSIFVRMSVSQQLSELQDVYINGTGTPLSGEVLIYDAVQKRWENHHLTAGSGVSVTNGAGTVTIANTAPDQVVALTGGTGITTSGTYPNFTITNSAPDQIVSLTGTGTATVTGTYPNFTINSADQYVGTVTSVNATAGTGISVSGGPITSSGSITITNTAPDQVVSLTGSGTVTVSGTYPNFTITGADQYVGTVTSVNATAGTGISVSGGPITSSGSITITNTAPDQVVSLTAGTGVSVTGTYPNFTIAATGGTGTVTSVNVSGGTTGLSFSGGPITTSGTITMAGTLAIANGGTNGSASPAAGAVAYGTGTAYAFTTAGTAGQVLLSNGTSAPSFGAVDGGTF